MQDGTNGPPFPKHFDGKRFYNPGAPQGLGLASVWRWKTNSRPEPSPAFVDDVQPSIPPSQTISGLVRATLVNHSTVLIQQSGLNILTDPIWAERASPLSWAGPRRRRVPGVRKENLPRIDIVLLSHNHYDHLDLSMLRWLASLGDCAFVVPLGVAGLLRSQKIGPVFELDWGEAKAFGNTTLHCVPALHFSARGIFDRNKTLWCGYVIQAGDGVIYFAGDTAFGDHFSQIRSVFGSPCLSLLPIGAYKPRWFMSPVHMDPQQAVKAHEILGSQTSVAIHHGTFQLADDGLDTALTELVESGKPDSFVLLKNGESVDLLAGERRIG